MAALEWRYFFNKWNFFSGQQKKMRINESILFRFRAFLVSKFAATIFTTQPDSQERHMWWRVYILESHYVKKRAQAMDDAIQRNNLRFIAYKGRLRKVIESHAQPGFVSRDSSLLKALYPRELINCLYEDKEIKPKVTVTDEKSARQVELQREQVCDAIKDYLFCKALTEVNIQNETLLRKINEAKEHKTPDRAEQKKILENQKAILQMELKQIQKKQLSSFYIDATTLYAGYLKVYRKTKHKLPVPTFRHVIGFRILHPFYLLDAIVGGMSLGIARFICYCLNGLTGKYKNSWLVNTFKILLSGLFILVDALTFTLAKLTSGSGVAEVIKACCKKSVELPINNKDSDIKDTKLNEPGTSYRLSVPPKREVDKRVGLYKTVEIKGICNAEVKEVKVPIEGKQEDTSHSIGLPPESKFKRKIETKVKRLGMLRRSKSVAESQFNQGCLFKRRYSFGDLHANKSGHGRVLSENLTLTSPTSEIKIPQPLMRSHSELLLGTKSRI